VFQIITALFVSFICANGLSLANDVSLPFYREWLGNHWGEPHLLTKLFIMNFCATVLVEYVVILLFLRPPAKARTGLAFWVFCVNAITNPVAQGLVLVLDQGFTAYLLLTAIREFNIVALIAALFSSGILVLIEGVAILVECKILVRVFGRMYGRGTIDEPVLARQALIMVIAANVVSFCSAWIINLPWIINMTQ
jgi:hypothetical protein